ncbi:hypothetical protein BC827DRAFT_318960 [Russula dissimulans]|nr:hypothetical protein BC827DRAFT_318960 [Russula dissimulans]
MTMSLLCTGRSNSYGRLTTNKDGLRRPAFSIAISQCLPISHWLYLILLRWTFRCMNLYVYHEWLVMILQTHAGALSVIRVHALYGRSRRVLGFLASVALMCFFTAAGIILAQRQTRSKPITVLSRFVSGCSHFTPSIECIVSAIAWSSVTVFNSVIFSLIVYKAFTMGRGIRLLNVIVRDDSMYFLALFIMNLANICILLHSAPLLRSSTSILTNVLSTTLVSRLVLNLREQYSTLAYVPTTIQTEEPRFQAGLPDTEQSMACIEGRPSVCTNNLIYEMDAIGADVSGPGFRRAFVGTRTFKLPHIGPR